MTFASLEFVSFLMLASLLYGLARPSQRPWLLLVASLAFIWSSGWLGLLLVTGTVFVDYFLAREIGSTESVRRRRQLVCLSLLWNLGILGYFKYANFALANVEAAFRMLGMALSLPRPDASVPPGISYFTFSSIGYVLDVYFRRLEPASRLRDYFLFLAYFPKFLAGPIARASDLLSQIREQARRRTVDVEVGAARFLVGAVKKCVIADQLAPHVDLIFVLPGQYDGFTLLQGVLGYAIQIYCDFSGYSDMAIGCARVLGVRLPENFSMPYASRSITEFWRRWHISLSAWFRDYLFLPLAYAISRRIESERLFGIRAEMWAYAVAILTTMLLCGLWHGASWNFVFWGGLHGAALTVDRVWSTWSVRRSRRWPIGLRACTSVLSRLATLGVILVGWVFFRTAALGEAVQYLGGILTWQAGTRVPSAQILGAIPTVILAHFVFPSDWAESVQNRPPAIRVCVYSTLLFLITTVGGSESAPFLYIQF